MKYIFDLDGTLYPWKTGLANSYIKMYAEVFDVSLESAEAEISSFWKKYGSSFGGMKLEGQHALSDVHRAAQEFHKYVDYSNILSFCPETKKLFSELKGTKIVHSNAPCSHVDRCLEILEITDKVNTKLGVDSLDFFSKPSPQSFEKVLALTRWNAEDVIFVEDKLINLEGAKKMGFKTVHIGWGENEYDDSHSHYVDRTYPTIIEFLEAEITKEPSL